MRATNWNRKCPYLQPWIISKKMYIFYNWIKHNSDDIATRLVDASTVFNRKQRQHIATKLPVSIWIRFFFSRAVRLCVECRASVVVSNKYLYFAVASFLFNIFEKNFLRPISDFYSYRRVSSFFSLRFCAPAMKAERAWEGEEGRKIDDERQAEIIIFGYNCVRSGAAAFANSPLLLLYNNT